MKQTAVEWLYENLKSHFKHDGDLFEVVQFSFEQAKEMEKQRIIDAFNNGYYQETIGYNASEQYYNETFKNK